MSVNKTTPLRRPEFKRGGQQHLTTFIRYVVGRPQVLIIIAAALTGGGIVLNWSWLVAAGAAPVLLALLPCAAMCVLGLCMRHKGDAACSDGGGKTVVDPDRDARSRS